MDASWWLVLGAILGAIAPGIALISQRKKVEFILHEKQERIDLLISTAKERTENSAKELELRSQADRLQVREELEKEFTSQRNELTEQKIRLERKESQIDRKLEQLDQKERELQQKRQRMDDEHAKMEQEQGRIQTLIDERQKRLEEVAHMTSVQAKAELIANLENEARREAAKLLKQLEEETREAANKRAQEVIATAIQRYAAEYVAEHTVSVVHLPSDEVKGRIIGREGRNIRALEAATGCDLIIDDTPDAVVISGFHPVRRQVAKRALDELVVDGRIHPARIEEVVRKIRKNIANEIREAGDQAVFDAKCQNVHPELAKLLGTLKFRTSYSQNVLNHSLEVAFLAGVMAEELGLDGNLARRCGLLHDIGKAVDHEVEGSHAIIGGQYAKKFREHPVVVNAIASHHFEVEPLSVYGPLTNAADALSAARPGARRETVETYIKRLKDLERIATTAKGVEKAYAIQAGREVRVFVEYDRVNDEGAMMLAREIATKVEEELSYPGQIKITVIREMRATEVAR
ncbi:MAG: ribonuclease Y [Magnetococcales bacterium]|nr:ribonuclease Y [Magnetococcales bacterium]NGZ27316.1 ribonuclease Y [Magnetococcales bacterium]